MTRKRTSITCVDCPKPVEKRYGCEVQRCWDCYNLNRTVTPQFCIDCGVPFINRKRNIRCRKCWRADVALQKVVRVSCVFHAPHGPIHVPEGHSVYWVRRSQEA